MCDSWIRCQIKIPPIFLKARFEVKSPNFWTANNSKYTVIYRYIYIFGAMCRAVNIPNVCVCACVYACVCVHACVRVCMYLRVSKYPPNVIFLLMQCKYRTRNAQM